MKKRKIAIIISVLVVLGVGAVVYKNVAKPTVTPTTATPVVMPTTTPSQSNATTPTTETKVDTKLPPKDEFEGNVSDYPMSKDVDKFVADATASSKGILETNATKDQTDGQIKGRLLSAKRENGKIQATVRLLNISDKPVTYGSGKIYYEGSSKTSPSNVSNITLQPNEVKDVLLIFPTQTNGCIFIGQLNFKFMERNLKQTITDASPLNKLNGFSGVAKEGIASSYAKGDVIGDGNTKMVVTNINVLRPLQQGEVVFSKGEVPPYSYLASAKMIIANTSTSKLTLSDINLVSSLGTAAIKNTKVFNPAPIEVNPGEIKAIEFPLVINNNLSCGINMQAGNTKFYFGELQQVVD